LTLAQDEGTETLDSRKLASDVKQAGQPLSSRFFFRAL